MALSPQILQVAHVVHRQTGWCEFRHMSSRHCFWVDVWVWVLELVPSFPYTGRAKGLDLPCDGIQMAMSNEILLELRSDIPLMAISSHVVPHKTVSYPCSTTCTESGLPSSPRPRPSRQHCLSSASVPCSPRQCGNALSCLQCTHTHRRPDGPTFRLCTTSRHRPKRWLINKFSVSHPNFYQLYHFVMTDTEIRLSWGCWMASLLSEE